MAKLAKVLPDLIWSAGGSIVGRVRLQKMMYLLDQKGLNSGANYIFHYYGPYSEDVADAISDAKFWEEIEEEVDLRKSDGSPFSIFRVRNAREVGAMGDLDAVTAGHLIQKLKSTDTTVLELAATIHWLHNVEKLANWEPELRLRKASKVGGGRLERAVQLLREMNLAPEPSSLR